MTTAEYAKIFINLHNAEYLTKDKSNYALLLLSQTTFYEGIVHGVPITIKVAHKFGERETMYSQQLHDCGIVYYPEHPYVLCIMTNGKDTKTLSKVISGISETVYRDVNTLVSSRIKKPRKSGSDKINKYPFTEKKLKVPRVSPRPAVSKL